MSCVIDEKNFLTQAIIHKLLFQTIGSAQLGNGVQRLVDVGAKDLHILVPSEAKSPKEVSKIE